MPLDRRPIWIGASIVVLVVAVLVGTGIFPVFKKRAPKTELTVWGLDSPSVWEPIVAQYHKDNPSVTVTYRALSAATYENDLVNGLATGQGPDIFMIGNAWLPKHGSKLAPAPANIITAAQADTLFPAAVSQDFAVASAVYALPLYMDTLALIYNRDTFDAKGVATPPTDWAGLQELSRRLGKGSVALGGSDATIEGASDILALLLMQSGAPMAGTDGKISFRGGEGALSFYAKFADPRSAYYAWDGKQPSAFRRFAAGNLPMLFGYHSEAAALAAANPALRIGIAPLPQNAGAAVNAPSYAGLAVWAKSAHPNEAWQFVKTLTAVPEKAGAYAAATNNPPALRALVSGFDANPFLATFARQTLTARSWPRRDEASARAALSAVIESVHGGAGAEQALREAEDALNR